MTVFKATQPVTMTASSVAGIFGFLSHNPVFEIANGSELKLENSAKTIEVDFRSVAGHPFTYGPHGPTGGLLASLQVNEPAGAAHIAFKFSGMYCLSKAMQEHLCRQYAAAQRGMPYDTMYAQCMYARGYRVPGFSPSPDSPGYQGELPGPAAHNGGA